MSLCRLMIIDFMEGGLTLGEDYDEYDLRNGKEYAEWLIWEGHVTEPFYGFDLQEFIQWCVARDNK